MAFCLEPVAGFFALKSFITAAWTPGSITPSTCTKLMGSDTSLGHVLRGARADGSMSHHNWLQFIGQSYEYFNYACKFCQITSARHIYPHTHALPLFKIRQHCSSVSNNIIK